MPEPTHNQMKEAGVAGMIEATTPMERATVLTELMTTKLGLNEGQSARVGKLNLDYSRRFSILMASTNPDIQKKSEFMRLSAEKEKKLKAIFNDLQNKAYNQNKTAYLNTYRIM